MLNNKRIQEATTRFLQEQDVGSFLNSIAHTVNATVKQTLALAEIEEDAEEPLLGLLHANQNAVDQDDGTLSSAEVDDPSLQDLPTQTEVVYSGCKYSTAHLCPTRTRFGSI